MPPANKNLDTQKILDSIRTIVKALRVSSRANEKECGLSGAQVFVLRQLENRKDLSMNELAELTHTHQSSVSVVVSKLHDEGLVSRKPSKVDSRKVEISLTPLGKKFLLKIPRSVQEQLIEAIENMPPSEAHQLGNLLDSLVKRAGLGNTAPPLFFEEEGSSS